MQDDNLSSLLEDLRSSDVAPQWCKEHGWERLDARLAKPKPARIQMWVYPAAAAALLLCLLLIPAHKPVFVAHHFVTPVSAPVQASNAPAEMRHSVAQQETKASLPLKQLIQTPGVFIQSVPIAVDTTAIASIPAEMPTIAPKKPPFIKRDPEVVYTLNEIMADVPEREAPPKKYSSIFRSQSASETPPSSQGLGRRSAMEQAPEIPQIIN